MQTMLPILCQCALNIVNKSLSIDLANEGITCVLLHPVG